MQKAAGPDPSGLGNFAYEGSESPPPKAHIGFCIAYASCREQVLLAILLLSLSLSALLLQLRPDPPPASLP